MLILNADRFYAEALQAAVERALPAVATRVSTTIAEADEILGRNGIELLVTGVGLIDGDALDLVAHHKREGKAKPRVLVITERKDHRVVVTLRTLEIDGVFDPVEEGARELERAIRCVSDGSSYWSGSVLRQLSECLAANAIGRILSAREQLVFSIIGDGSDDEEAAASLGLKKMTVASVRRDLHRKLNVQHKGELVRVAVQHGFVRFTPGGVVRPGFAALLAACRRHHKLDRLKRDEMR